jgi:cytochrome c-type biogenesis protein CcmH/NrfG
LSKGDDIHELLDAALAADETHLRARHETTAAQNAESKALTEARTAWEKFGAKLKEVSAGGQLVNTPWGAMLKETLQKRGDFPRL